jgi:ribosomal subunit interface protein
MDVIVRGKNIPVPAKLRNVAQRKLGRLERVTRDAVRAEVDFFEERNPRIAERHRCAVVVHRRHQLLAAHAVGSAPEAALERVLDKLRHQVARQKDHC